MDIRMPRASTASRRRGGSSRGDGGAPRVLVLTTFDLDEYVYEALRAGASGFLLKDAPEEQLVDGRSASSPTAASLFAPAVTRRLIERFAAHGRAESAPPAARRADRRAKPRSSRSSRAACRTPRSPSSWSSASTRSRPTWPTSSASSACATAFRRSCLPTRPGWCAPARPESRRARAACPTGGAAWRSAPSGRRVPRRQALVQPHALDHARRRAGEVVGRGALAEGQAEMVERAREHLLEPLDDWRCSSMLGRLTCSLHRPYGTALSHSAHSVP